MTSTVNQGRQDNDQMHGGCSDYLAQRPTQGNVRGTVPRKEVAAGAKHGRLRV